jgi:hypothetical protein
MAPRWATLVCPRECRSSTSYPRKAFTNEQLEQVSGYLQDLHRACSMRSDIATTMRGSPEGPGPHLASRGLAGDSQWVCLAIVQQRSHEDNGAGCGGRTREPLITSGWSLLQPVSGRFGAGRKPTPCPLCSFSQFQLACLGSGMSITQRLGGAADGPPEDHQAQCRCGLALEGNDAHCWIPSFTASGSASHPRGGVYVLQFRLPDQAARRMTIGVHGSPWSPEK